MSTQTVEHIRDLLIDRLVSGQYPVGSQLPTVRALADEIGAHRNTVAKAYGALADMGHVSLRQGRGTYVTSLHNLETQTSLSTLFFEDLDRLVAYARRIGVPESDLRSAFDEQIAMRYASRPIRAAMVECNVEDIDAAIAEVKQATGARLHPLLLDDLRTDPLHASEGYSVIVTSLFHIKEVNALLNVAPSPVPVVSLYTQPDEEALRRIAEIEPDAHIGIVANNVEGARRFAAQVRSVTVAESTLLLAPSDAEIRALAAQVDVFVSSRSQFDTLRRLALDVPIIELPFHVSPQSVAYLVERLGNRTHTAA
jgi:DNA-binding transcriptional regulator YhcF (GntR family)